MLSDDLYASIHDSISSIKAGSDGNKEINDKEITQLLKRLSSPGCRNWVKCSIALCITKEALHNFVFDTFTEFATKLTTEQKTHSIAEFHNHTSSQTIVYSHQKRAWVIKDLNCVDCKRIMDRIIDKHMQSTKICWNNIRGSCLPLKEAWVIAKVFMPRGSEHNSEPKDTDAAALFKVMETCSLFDSIEMSDRKNLSRTRNTLMHSRDNFVNMDDMEIFFENMIRVLENEESGLKRRKECQRTVSELTMLKRMDVFSGIPPHKNYSLTRSALEIKRSELKRESKQTGSNDLKTTLRICKTDLQTLSGAQSSFLDQEIIELRDTLRPKGKTEKTLLQESMTLKNELSLRRDNHGDSENTKRDDREKLISLQSDLEISRASEASLKDYVKEIEEENTKLKEQIKALKEEKKTSLRQNKELLSDQTHGTTSEYSPDSIGGRKQRLAAFRKRNN